MITLNSVFQLFGICVAFTLICMFIFGLLLKHRHTFIAPRCAARPKNTIYYHDDNNNGQRSIRRYTNPFFGWIGWSLTLSYDTLLSGIPNTGTRNGGKSGKLLSVNLDGIILIRFHEMCLRISIVASFLCIVIILPLYASSWCHNETDYDDSKCTNIEGNMTNYERITIANVPGMGEIESGRTYFIPSRNGTLGRYYAVVLCFWILIMYTLHDLRKQWVQNLALRRAYFTESNVWGDRQKELDQIQQHDNTAPSSPLSEIITDNEIIDDKQKNTMNALRDRSHNNDDPEDYTRLNQRDVWIPHPEQSDTVPHIALYSVLVGKLPTPANAEKDKRKLVDLHLALVSRFFDDCVPNQPGFSSSVAAVTILPGASDMAQAWKKWYIAVSRLRRLRFIREHIAKRRGDNNENNNNGLGNRVFSHSIEKDLGLSSPSKSILQVEDDVEIDLESEMNFGPEQMAVYSREFAQSGAACCPHGFNEKQIINATLEELLDLEDDVQESLQQATQELQHARQRIAASEGMSRSSALSSHEINTFRDSQFVDFTSSFTLESNLLRRHRAVSATTLREVSRWKQVVTHVEDSKEEISDGVWKWPTLSRFIKDGEQFQSNEIKAITSVHELYNESTYAIVTFTSRQAAIAARQCLADGRGKQNWDTMSDLPIPPLADASACDDICVCRNCCRPVTLTISDRAKNWRRYIAMALLGVIYFFYTVPLTAAASLLDPDKISQVFPRFAEWGIQVTVASLLQSLLWSIFFSLNPIMFKAISNFGSNATSMANAELSALRYFWWFMVLSAFTGSWFTTMLVHGFNHGPRLAEEFREVVRQIADSIVNISATWLHWTIFHTFVIFPLNYLIGVNTFIFYYLRLPFLARVQIGGGSGGPTPYRIYVDSGVVLMCVFALAPSSPILAPFVTLYFLVLQPLIRRNLVFVYRPKFDGGGFRWPFIFEMCISAAVVGEILLTVQMILRGAIGPATLSAATAIPTVLVYMECRKRFKRPYRDAALLQTSFLDGWDPKDPWSEKKRESFRKWLVDAHKAAYVPVCLSGNDSDNFLTAEPAVVVEIDEEAVPKVDSEGGKVAGKRAFRASVVAPKHQPGAVFCRLAGDDDPAIAENGSRTSHQIPNTDNESVFIENSDIKESEQIEGKKDD